MSDKQWYYTNGSERKGPVDENAAKALIDAGVIESETLIWSDGMDDWVPAYRHLRGLVPPAPTNDGAGRRMAGAPRVGARAGAVDYAEPINMGGAFSRAFRKFGDFTSRASRGEFWWFLLASILISIVASMLDVALFEPVYDPGTGLAFQMSPLNWLWTLIAMIPTLAVGARRLHDINRSGWWQLIVLTLVGVIVLIVWWAQAGDQEANTFG